LKKAFTGKFKVGIELQKKKTRIMNGRKVFEKAFKGWIVAM